MEACPYCGAAKLLKHGLARNGKQRYFCPGYRRTSRSAPGTNAYDEARKAEMLRAYQYRTSLRSLTRIFGVSRHHDGIVKQKPNNCRCRARHWRWRGPLTG